MSVFIEVNGRRYGNRNEVADSGAITLIDRFVSFRTRAAICSLVGSLLAPKAKWLLCHPKPSFSDGKGNITAGVNSSQALWASYRYDPFGNTISSSGILASANVDRFSSNELLVNGGLYYFGYRW